MGSANTFQNRYRWRNDNGGETSATWKAGINTGFTPDASLYTGPFRLRVEVSNDGGKAESSGAYLLRVDVDGGGYNAVTPTSTDGVKMVASGTVTDDVQTTEQMAGSQFFIAGRFDSNGAATAITLGSVNDTEVEFCIQLDASVLTGSEVLSFRVYRDTTALDSYSVTPTITAPTPPQPTWAQSEFRIRAAGAGEGDSQALNANAPEGDWEAAADTNVTLRPYADRHGIVFGIRWKVSGGNVSGSKTLKTQVKKNTGSWTDLTAQNHNDQANLVTAVEAGIIPTNQFTDGATTTQVLSGSNFVGGTGEHSGTFASVTLDLDEHTELEQRYFINKTWAAGASNQDADYFEFRLVESDGTALTTYTVTPRITVDYDNNYVGGCYPESIGRYGIFYASDGDAFAFVEGTELDGEVMAMCRLTGETEWKPVDQSNSPASLADLECFHVDQDGNTLHLFYAGGDVRYETFNMSTHAWGGLEEQVSTSMSAVNQVVCGHDRSDGTVVCAWVDSNEDLVLKVRSGAGVWDISTTTVRTGTVTGASSVKGASDKIYFVAYEESLGAVRSRSYSSSGVLGTVQVVLSSGGRSSGSGFQWAVIAPVYWDDGGNEKIGVIYQKEADAKLYWSIITNDGSPGTEAVVTDNAVADNETAMNSRQPAAQAMTDGSTTYVAYSRASTDYDLYLATSENGAAFGTDVEIQDGITAHAVGIGIDSGTMEFIVEHPYWEFPGYSGYTGGIQVYQYTLPGGTVNASATVAMVSGTETTAILGVEFQQAVLAALVSDTSDTPVLGLNRPVSGLVGWVSSTSDTAVLGLELEQLATIALQSGTNDNVALAFTINALAAVAIQSGTPDTVPLLRDLTATASAAMQSGTPDDVALLLDLSQASLITMTSLTSAGVLGINYPSAALVALQSDTNDLVDLSFNIFAAALVGLQSTTNDSSQLLLELQAQAAVAVQTQTNDAAVLALELEQVASILAASGTSTTAVLALELVASALIATVSDTNDLVDLAVSNDLLASALVGMVSATSAPNLVLEAQMAALVALQSDTNDLAVLGLAAEILAAASVALNSATATSSILSLELPTQATVQMASATSSAELLRAIAVAAGIDITSLTSTPAIVAAISAQAAVSIQSGTSDPQLALLLLAAAQADLLSATNDTAILSLQSVEGQIVITVSTTGGPGLSVSVNPPGADVSVNPPGGDIS